MPFPGLYSNPYDRFSKSSSSNKEESSEEKAERKAREKSEKRGERYYKLYDPAKERLSSTN